MTDKRSESERVSARTPLPSIAPPTDDIDSEWGADDEIPAPARLPQLGANLQATATPAPSLPAAHASTPAPASAPAPVAHLATPLPAARLPTPVPAAPRPASSVPPVARASAPAPAPSPASALATPATTNPLRKQTLLGIAPVMPALSQPPTASEPPSPAAAASTPDAPSAPPAVAAASSTPLAANPLRKQTLFGIAPVLPASAPSTPTPAAEAAATPAAAEAAATPATEQAAPADDEPVAQLPSSPPAGIASSSPFTRDVSTTSAPPAAPSVAASSTEHELRALRPRRSRWLLPVAAAALIALGVVGLRRLDHSAVSAPPPPAPAAPNPAAVHREPEAIAPTPAPSAHPAAEDEHAKPPPSSPDAEPLAKSAEAVTGDVRKIRVGSSPPGARLFWRGKEVGTTPFTLELQPGEKHSYELGLPGYVTRKVVIDGSKSEISIGMKPEPGVSTGVKSRK